MRPVIIALMVLTLAGCKEEAVQNTAPLPLSEAAIGHYCQMNLLEHEGPKAQVHLAGLPGAPLFFSQVRDALAYMRMPEQSHQILAIWVNDMGAPGATWATPGRTNWIAADDAIYVVDGHVVGGMGAPEIVPFTDLQTATEFTQENGGQIMRLAEIPDSAVLAPVELNGDSGNADFEDRLRSLSRKVGE
ncbi:nitrous oxide reductase accessory protein NosL [Roseovarius sp. Pro17]|uniref:nitrous oxide reductase accessory protein NosL n=1 Tax=Roseovarius sp. Pro17 TaxID=3108175 RepID=UPI002D78F992|nr:nitrous oxide reductase accessory protein NosL [Roseovarius sp. Pro17]